MITLNFYYRQGCHLCEDMLALIASYQVSVPIQLQMHDIDVNPELKQRYTQLIPVLSNAEGKEICHHFFDKERFEHFLQQSTAT